MKRDEASNGDCSGDDSLDRLLHQASWPEPETERVERLWQQWLVRPRVHPINIPLTLAAAAAILLALTGGLLWARFGNQPRPLAQKPAELVEVIPSEPPLDYLLESRTPTSYETIVIVAAEQRRRATKESHGSTVEPSPIEQAIAQLNDDPDAEPAKVIESITRSAHLTPGQFESDLGQFVRSHSGVSRLVAVRLLASMATRRSLPLLLHLSSKPDTHAVAIPGLARLVDAASLAQLAADESDSTLQSYLLAELLQRGGQNAVTLFLNFVLDRRSVEVAMNAVDSVAEPPVEILFQMLESSNYPLRIAAARVLGRLDGPIISHRLADMVLRDMNRREALIALVSCPGEDAVQFLAIAERSTGLTSNIRAARSQLHALQ